jgi:hypothetical protein
MRQVGQTWRNGRSKPLEKSEWFQQTLVQRPAAAAMSADQGKKRNDYNALPFACDKVVVDRLLIATRR